MDRRGPSVSSLGTDSQDSDDLNPPGTAKTDCDTSSIKLPKSPAILASAAAKTKKGIENAKKRLRAFSIQKKTPIAPVVVPKPVNTGSTTVLIGKLSSVKTTPKPEPEPDAKKIPRPPKPGGSRRNLQDSYTDLQKRTLAEIEDMKRKMELVELGIPLGLICPTSTSDKAMPTKAMPPIKSFLDASKVDEIIRQAKKAKAEGKEFKFDYHKLLPDYDNPFQRKKDEYVEKESYHEEEKLHPKVISGRERKDSRKSDKYDRRHSDHKREDRDKDRHKDKERDKTKERDREWERVRDKEKIKDESKKSQEEVTKEKNPKETDVNLNDYLVCDSWSLDNDDKNTASPKVDIKNAKLINQQIEQAKLAANLVKETLMITEDKSFGYIDKPSTLVDKTPASVDSPKPKIEKLQPVIDSFKFEIDPNEDALDIFDEDTEINKFAVPTAKRDPYDSPIDLKLFDYDQDLSKEGVIDANDDNFLESVINEIKQENMSDDTSQDKGLVEYDLSPKDDYDDSKMDTSQGSVTPELDDRMRDLQSSQSSHYSDGYRSTESGYKSVESYKSSGSSYKSKKSGYKKGEYRSQSRQSSDFRLSVEKDLDEALEAKMSKSTVDSLETWSFVLKICQPLLFRHDRNKCYKQTHVAPKLWYAENPKGCSCVKDRSVVYEELEMCKMGLVDRVYGCDQIPDEPFPDSRTWYPRVTDGDDTSASLPLASEWETEEVQRPVSKSLTPQHDGTDICLDREYQKFMEAVWPEVTEKPPETSRSTTPVRQETRKKKKAEDPEKDTEDKKKAKKMKLSSEGWSQESDMDDEGEKPKKIKREKSRKRRHSTSSESTISDSEEDGKKKKKIKKKGSKKLKTKLAKKRRIGKKLKKQLKDKQKKKKKISAKIQELSDDTDEMKEKKKDKKAKKKKQLKQKKLQKKKKAKAKPSSSSSSSSSSSDTDSEVERKKKIKKKEIALKKKKKDKKKKRKQSTDSTQSDELFDVNVLNNIKAEKISDEEKMDDFSPRRQKPREIINVKELQNDFVGSNIHIKQEKIDQPEEEISQGTAIQSDRDKSVDKVQTQDISPSVEKPKIPIEKADVTSEEKVKIQSPTEIKVTEKKVQPIKSSVQSDTVEKIPVQPTPVEKPSVQTIPVPVAAIPTPVQKPVGFVDSKAEVIEVKKPIPESVKDQPIFKIEESHMIPLPEEPTHSLENIAMPPEKPIETIESRKIKPITLEYTFETSQSELYDKDVEACEDKFGDTYSQDNYEMYEHMAMAYQSDVASQQLSGVLEPVQETTQRIETVVRRRGEIKCDWRAGDSPAATAKDRPSRWGLKPGEVNIVLTGGPNSSATRGPVGTPIGTAASGPAAADTDPGSSEQFPIRSVLEPVYEIRSIANRTDNSSIGYDEAYMDTYGAADRLQYGDCFDTKRRDTLDDRISQVLRDTVLGEVAKETDDAEEEKDTPEKGILVTKSLVAASRGSKRVSFADGYKPGQDSDVEEPPAKKKKKPRRVGCAWPCPAAHPAHVPLWDALPPPPPPPGSPPPPIRTGPPIHLLRRMPQPQQLPQLPQMSQLPQMPHLPHNLPHLPPGANVKIDPNSLPPFMPPEPPPGLINFQ